VVYTPRAESVEALEVESAAGFRRRLRSSLGGLTTLFSMPALLNPQRHPVVALQLLSHKLLRFWLVPLLVGAYLANAPLLGAGQLYAALFALQSLLWIGVALGAFQQRFAPFRGGGVFRILFTFLQQHAASFVAFLRFLKGNAQATRWETRGKN
jgi:hypothetical protein